MRCYPLLTDINTLSLVFPPGLTADYGLFVWDIPVDGQSKWLNRMLEQEKACYWA